MGAAPSRGDGGGAPQGAPCAYGVHSIAPAPSVTAAASLCVGIDLGTARSGWAFAYGPHNAPLLNFNWPGETTQQAKTLTALLYHGWQPVAWGADAYKQ